jgi:hypothetical protein
MPEQPHTDRDPAFADAPAAGPRVNAPDREDGIVDGDAATHLEALVLDAVAPATPTAGAEGLLIETPLVSVTWRGSGPFGCPPFRSFGGLALRGEVAH